MIFITNNCLDTYLEQQEHTNYISPTVNLSITKENFFELIKHIDDEDLFDDFQIFREEKMLFQTKRKRGNIITHTYLYNVPYILLTCGVRLNATHFIKLTDEEIRTKILRRVERFKKNKSEGICFCLTVRKRLNYDEITYIDILRFDELKTKYPRYVVTNKEDVLTNNAKTIIVKSGKCSIPSEIFMEVIDYINEDTQKSKAIGS